MGYNYQPWQKLLLLTILLVALIGIIDSAYLSYSEATGTETVCSLTGGCSIVLTSPYAYMFGHPLSYIGVFFYVSIFLLTVLTLLNRQSVWLKLISLGGLSGFLMSLYFVYIQLFEIYSICQYCMLSALTSTLIFIGTATLYFTSRKINPPIQPPSQK